MYDTLKKPILDLIMKSSISALPNAKVMTAVTLHRRLFNPDFFLKTGDFRPLVLKEGIHAPQERVYGKIGSMISLGGRTVDEMDANPPQRAGARIKGFHLYQEDNRFSIGGDLGKAATANCLFAVKVDIEGVKYQVMSYSPTQGYFFHGERSGFSSSYIQGALKDSIWLLPEGAEIYLFLRSVDTGGSFKHNSSRVVPQLNRWILKVEGGVLTLAPQLWWYNEAEELKNQDHLDQIELGEQREVL